MSEQDRKLPDVGTWFEWRSLDGKLHAGIVTEIDSNVVIITDAYGREHAYEG